MADERKPSDRKFRTLFDGDEIDGKFYGLGEGVTGLDAPTGEYLVSIGRLEDVTDEVYADLPNVKGKGKKAAEETDEERAAREAREAEERADADRLDAARADVDAGRLPDDLVDTDKPADAADRLISGDKLRELAKAEGVTFKSNAGKGDLAAAIMANRAKAAPTE